MYRIKSPSVASAPNTSGASHPARALIPTHAAGAMPLAILLGSSLAILPVASAQEASWNSGNDEASGQEERAHAGADSIASARSVTLPPVVVQDRPDSELPGAYAGGQVAKGGRAGLLGTRGFMNTPFNTISYTQQYIENLQARELADVIAKTDASVFYTGQRGITAEHYMVRGFDSNINDAMLDGMFGLAPYYRASPEMFERIEVLKGPSALLNGMAPAGSVGGAINLVPKRASNDPLTRLTGTWQSRRQLGIHADVGRRFGESKQFGLRFNSVYRNGESAIRDQDREARVASLGMDWRLGRGRLSADLYTTRDRVDGVNRGISLAPGVAVPRPPSLRTGLSPSWTYFETDDRAGLVRGEVDLSNNLTAYAAFGASRSEYETVSPLAVNVTNAAGDSSTSMAYLHFIVNKKSADIGTRGKFQTGDIRHELTANVTHYSEELEQGFVLSVLPQPLVTNIYAPAWGPSPGSSFTPSVFGKNSARRLTSYGIADTLSFAGDSLQLTLGVRRQEVVNEAFAATTGTRTSRYDKGATTPSIAGLARLTDGMSLYGNYIEGLSIGDVAPTTAANAGEVFAPYKTKQKEVGLKIDSGRLSSTISLFEIKRPSSYTDPVTNVFSSGGMQRNRGLEWNFFGVPLEGVRLMGGIAYVDPKLTRTAGGVNQGKTATSVPKLQAKLGAEWDLSMLPGLTVGANVMSSSRQYVDTANTLVLGGRTVYDLNARYATSIAGKPVTVRGSVTNLTNKAYWSTTLYRGIGLGEPRTFMLSATVDF